MEAVQASVFGLTQPTGGAASPAGGKEEGVATQAAPQEKGMGAPGPCGSPMTLVMMLVMFAAFYFLLIRPQQKKAKEHQKMLESLKKGDEVVTNGGIVGKITGIADKLVIVEVSEKVRVRVVKSQVNKYEGGLENK